MARMPRPVPTQGRSPASALARLGLATVLVAPFAAPAVAADFELRRGLEIPFEAPPDLRRLPRNDPLQDLPTATQDSSILRIGRARPAEPVADGRVDRPAPRPGTAGTLPGASAESGLVVVRQDVRDLIGQVARFYGFDTVLTRQVQGDVTNARLPSDFNAFLDRLGEDRDLVFYFRNRELNGSARAENVSRVIGLGPSSPQELRAAIEAAGVDADRFPLQFIEASNSVLVNGPPSFVALVEVIAESLVRTDRSAADITVIRGNQIDRNATDGAGPIQPPASPGAPASREGGLADAFGDSR